jgi:SAM-dependent methyltransferase
MRSERVERTDRVLKREQNERETFSRVAVGRSAADDQELLTVPSDLECLRDVVSGRRAPMRPLEQMFAWAAPLAGRRVLEVCGHHGEFGALLAHLGAEVDSVDITPPLVGLAERRAHLNHLEGRFRPAVMSVHEMTFPDATFDVVFGKAALHHLDLRLARDEIFRVLKPGGFAVFQEPVQLMPVMVMLRDLVPVPKNAESPDERPLSADDLEAFCAPFARCDRRYFRLLQRFDRIVPRLGRSLGRLDARLLDLLPSLGQAAGSVVFRVWKP